MARLHRCVIPGQPQHIIQRGNNRQAIFAADADYRFFREALVEAAILILATSPSFRLYGRRFEAVQHEVHEGVPVLEAQVAGQGADVVEQALARGQFLAQ